MTREDIEESVVSCVTSVLRWKNSGVEYDHESDPLQDMDFDQTEFSMIVSSIESEFDIHIPEYYIKPYYFSCADDIVRIVARELAREERYSKLMV